MNNYQAYVNLDHRNDRREHMILELFSKDIEAVRFSGILPQDVHVPKAKKAGMIKRGTLGAIGCHFAQVGIMEQALKRKQNAFVMEDDLIFCEDFQIRIKYIDNWMESHDWDVFWLGGTFHSPAHWHSNPHNRELPQCKCNLGRDVEPTSDPRIVRTFGAFSTFAYIVNIKSLPKILKLLDENVHMSMGIDWLLGIYLGPQLKNFAFVPGCVKQMDNQSDIGKDITMFSGFSKLNGTEENSRYWFQKKMEDFDPTNWQWR